MTGATEAQAKNWALTALVATWPTIDKCGALTALKDAAALLAKRSRNDEGRLAQGCAAAIADGTLVATPD